MAGKHITFRIFSDSVPLETEMPEVGEPFWDPLKAAFGVFNGGAVIKWFQRVIGDVLALPIGVKAGGVDSTGALNPIRLDFSVANTFRILGPNDTVIAEFTADASTFNTVASVQTGVPGVVNRLINAGLQCTANIFSPLWPVSTAGMVTGAAPKLVAPNWMLWKTNSAFGDIAATLSSDVPVADLAYSMRCRATGAPNSAGVRMFCYGYKQLRGKKISLSQWVKGPVGGKTKVRLITQQGTVLALLDVDGTDAWVRLLEQNIDIVDDGSTWMALDVVYVPGYNAATTQDWFVAGPQINVGTLAAAFENRPPEVEQNFVASIYQEVRRHVSVSQTYLADMNLLSLGIVPRVAGKVSSTYVGSVTLNSPAASGVLVEVANNVSPGLVDVVGYLAPTSTETN